MCIKTPTSSQKVHEVSLMFDVNILRRERVSFSLQWKSNEVNPPVHHLS